MSMSAAPWRRTGYGAGGLLALAALFLGVIMLANLGLRGLRLDLTQNHLYTLSPGSTLVLAQLNEPVNLYFYFSREAASNEAPLLLPYANRVQEFLQELAARSAGKLRLRVIDPPPFSDDEDHAGAEGLQALHAGANGAAIYFGLAGTNSTDGHAAIASFQTDREEFLEYDIAKLVHELGTPKKPVIGLLSTLDMQGQFNPMTGQAGEAWPIVNEIEQLFSLRTLRPDADQIDRDVDVLMLVHPKNLPSKTLYAIDQFVMRGGHLLLFLDPESGAAPGHASDLQPLLRAWGVAYDPGQVIGDLELGLDVRTSMQAPPLRHIAILGLHRADMEAKDVVTASLQSINMATSGFLTALPGAKTQFEPLLQSSASAAPIAVARFAGLTDPSSLRDGFKPTGTHYALAARVSGAIDSAYPAGPPADVTPAAGPPAAGPPVAHLTKSSAPANIVIVADTDMLLDFMWVQTRELFGQRVSQAFANNGDFVANILDNLSGSSALISIRGRANFNRPFERIEALRRQADDHLRSKAQELEAQLKQTETKLMELQTKRQDQSSVLLSPEQEQELSRFTAGKVQIRKELRETQRGLNVDIDQLETWIKLIDIALMPLLVSAAGIGVLAWRKRRKPARTRPT
jgi:ABC-type uncharacterized transport system involved in gliding motility auxiliary subunit